MEMDRRKERDGRKMNRKEGGPFTNDGWWFVDKKNEEE
jgi:hypothetical protein